MKQLLRFIGLLALSSCALAGNYIGDYALGDTIYCKFGTVRPSTGASFTLAGSPVVSAYPDASTTQLTAGITLTVDFDGVTGMNHLTVVASGGNGYAAGSFYSLQITTGTVDSISVTGQEVCSFSLGKVSALRPATAGRTLVVDAAGLADANTVKLGPTGAGTAQTARDVGASVLLSSGTGTGQLSITSGIAAVNATQFAGASLTTPTGAIPTLGIVDSGTAQAATATTIQIRSAATFGDNELTGKTVVITGGTTGVGQSATIASNVGSTDTATVPTWTTTPTGTITYAIFGTATASGGSGLDAAATRAALGLATANLDTQLSGISTKTGFLPSATAGAAGGVQIAGSNAATTYADFDVTANASFAGGITITQSTSNTPALVVTGNGTGNGATITSGSGATGTGLSLVAASTNGAGLTTTGTGTGNGATFTSGGGATGSGAQFTAASTNGNGIGLTATGTGVTQTISPANVTQIAGQTASASGAVTFPGTIASATNITAATGITVATNNDKTGYTLSAAGNTGLLDTSLSGHTTGGTVGGALNSASSAGDPWGTLIPGAYSAGTAGNILGNRLDAAISTRQATLTLPTNFSSLAITGGGAVTVGTNNDKTGYSASTVSDKTGYSLAANAIDSTSIATSGASKISAAVATTQGILTGTCSSGSTTTCVDAALTQAAASQLQDRLICFSDSWCGLITTFNPATDTATTTKVAPSTRASLTYTIFPSTTQ